ncbi:17.6 kDa class II heat shock protein-like [Punica granatum]|uniref:SHSP domain-containing protein n=2 Tax=Punica granatum TaxID=22663 RepID=A0A218XPI1_PUNGR|nr:17.6 kDa class II heat shock protein-like [Punica granatum]OWM86546.1 hypothetical protein CDL15_Pgr015581 [Punica granatum]PKI72067.1 hypothetical protein CRG98_007524 [Punica granatum]
MDFRNFGEFGLMGSPIFSIIEDMLDFPEDQQQQQPESRTRSNNPSRAYVRDAKAMAATPADVIEYPDSYVFIVDMPGINPGEIKVQVENENVLVVSSERRHEREKDKDESKVDGLKYVRMERRVGKFMRKFVLPENANVDAISAMCQDGVLRVTVQKVKPPQPKAKTIEVKVG